MVTIDLREVEVEVVLDDLGIEVMDRTEDNLLCRCPFHDDQHRSFSINKDSGLWICYAGCGEGGLVKLVSEVEEVDFSTAKTWLEDRGGTPTTVDRVMSLLDQPIRETPTVRPEDLIYDQSATYHYMVKRGFDPAVLREWRVGRDLEKKSVVIPVYNNGRLISVIHRPLHPVGDKKYEYPEGFAKSRVLFGADKLPEEYDYVVVTEGPLDVLWLHQHGEPAVGLLGSSMSEEQASLLARKTRLVILMLDNDEAGYKGTKKAINRLVGRVRVMVAEMPRGKKDAQDCTASELKLIIEHAVDSVLWLTEVR